MRWINFLRPHLKHGNFSEDEDDLILKLHALLGNKWSLIAGRLPGRTDNEIKNYWNSHLQRKLISMGIDPLTHRAFQKNSLHYRSLPRDDTEPEITSSHEVVHDFFHCPSELSVASEQVSNAASGLERDGHPDLNLNLDLGLSISGPSIQAVRKGNVVNSEEGESDLSEGKGYLVYPLLRLR